MGILDRFRQQSETRVATSGDVRDPRAATQSLTFTSPGVRMLPEWDADSAIREAYLSSVVVYACVQTIAKAVASCDLRAILPGKDVADFDPHAPLARLLGPAPGSPNPNLSARRLWMNATANYIVTGKFAWELEAPQGASLSKRDWAPVALWPLVARVLEVIPTDGGSTLFSGFRYGRGDRKVDLFPSQVFYTYNPSLNDFRQAASALQPMRYDIVAEVMQSVYDAAFLRNDARPAGVLVHQAFEEKSQERAWEQQFEANHRSPQNANRIAFAEFEPGDDKQAAPIMWINMGLSQKDAMMLATQQDKVTRICMGLGVPQSMLDASGRTFNNGGLEARNFWTNTILPFLADFEDEINRDLAPRLGVHVAKFDTRHVEDLKAPSKFTTASIGDLVDRKVIFPEEGRTDMGFPAYSPEQLAKIAQADIGSTLLEQAAYITALSAGGWDAATIATIMGVKAPPKPDPTPAPLLLPPGSVKVKQTPQDYSTTSAVIGLVRELGKEQTRAEQRAATWRQMDAQTRAAEGAWTKAVKRLFARQKKQTIDRLDSRKARWAKSLETRDDPINPDDIFDPTFQEQQTEDALSALFESLVSASGARVAAQHGFGFNVNDPKIQAMIDQRVSKLAEQITGTTYDAIKSVILTGITSGEGIPAIAAGIEAVFAGADATRAELIARTETIAASADGALASYEQGVLAGALDGYGLVWIAEMDNRCCETCADLDGEQIPFGDTFSDGEDGPPDHPDCRCAVGAEPMDQVSRSVPIEGARVMLRAIAEGQITSTLQTPDEVQMLPTPAKPYREKAVVVHIHQAPVSMQPAAVTVAPAQITVNGPARMVRETTFIKDEAGEITGSRETEREAD